MFDNLRDFSDEPLYEDETNDLYKEPESQEAPATAVPAHKSKKKKSKKFLGMTAQQRFILSVLLMLSVCMAATLIMFVFEKMSI